MFMKKKNSDKTFFLKKTMIINESILCFTQYLYLFFSSGKQLICVEVNKSMVGYKGVIMVGCIDEKTNKHQKQNITV